MSREILFRAKHIHTLPGNEHLNGRWIEGYLSNENHINSPELAGEFLIDPGTVCQYTGLTDKNGRKIFEGDIVKDDSAQLKGAIKFSERYLQFIVDDVDDGEQDYSDFMKEVEIIGNIFDNPELLEGETE